MALRDKLGYEIDLNYYLRGLYNAKVPPKFDYLISSWKWEVPSMASHVATCYYLQENKTEAAKFAKETVDTVLEYFFGNWREHALTDKKIKDRAWWRVHASWMNSFSEGLCWASAIKDSVSASEIAAYPDDDCEVDVCCTKEDRAAYLAMAYFYRGEPVKKYQHHLEEIRNRKKEKPKRIADVIEALQSNDALRFQQTLEAYLNYFRKREFKRTSLGKLLCYDGTSLVNIGKQHGLDFKIPPEVEDHIIRFD